MRAFLLTFIVIFFTAAQCWAEMPVVGFVTGASGLGDLSFNDMSYGGVRRAQQEYKFKLIILEPGKSGESTDKEFVDLIKQSDVLLLIGAQHEKLVRDHASEFPAKKFILVEVPLEGMENVSSVAFEQGEGSFMAGALAAGMSKTGAIGFIGGTPVVPVQKFEQGYVEGAKYMNPDIRIDIAYVTPLGDFSGFNAPDKGHALAMNMYRGGVDIIFTVAGLTGNGVIEAARRSNKFAIGVDSDQDSLAKGHVLSSMIKKLDVACYDELKAVMENKFKSGASFYGIKEDGVGLSQMKYTSHLVPQGVMEKLESIKEKISNREIAVEFVPPAQ